jgi:hypothetical protein
MGLILLVLGVVCFFVYRTVYRTVWPPAGEQAEARSETRIPEEELVATWIRNNSYKPEQVTFLRWGPHMRREEIIDLFREAGFEKDIAKLKKEDIDELPDVIIRVVFRTRVASPFAIAPGMKKEDDGTRRDDRGRKKKMAKK